MHSVHLTTRCPVIYFARPDQSSHVKIGFTASSDPAARIPAIQTGQPTRVRVMATTPGGREDEAELHARFAADRLEGEWFRTSGELAWVVASCNVAFRDLAIREPRLAGLVRHVGDRWMRPHPPGCRLETWYGYDGGPNPRDMVCDLVGFGRRDEKARRLGLDTPAAYDLAYDTLLGLLPNCTGGPCGCEWE